MGNSLGPKLADLGYPQSSVETSSAEMIQGWNTGAKVVKWSLPTALYIDDPQQQLLVLFLGRRLVGSGR